ncbi:MAG: RNase adapter RapZ [Eubacteriales bacterium]
MQLTIVTGLSGAGRTSALHRLEDLKYFCVDNLPPELIPSFAQLCLNNPKPLNKVAIAVDTRMGDWFNTIYEAIDTLKKMDLSLSILYLDSSDSTLVSRFKQTRRPHPLSQSGDIVSGIHAERRLLQRIKDLSDRVIDTSTYSVRKLYDVIDSYFTETSDSSMLISVISFGYKRGIPLDADLVFDMRFIPNPFYIEHLKNHSGLAPEVKKFVFSFERVNLFIDKIVDMVNFIAPYFLEQDKKQLVICIGCTGGMHRSVAVAQELYNRLSQSNSHVYLEHRDLNLEKNSI